MVAPLVNGSHHITEQRFLRRLVKMTHPTLRPKSASGDHATRIEFYLLIHRTVSRYMTYIIDHYDRLPDISLFMHAHREAWHNGDIFNWDAAVIVKTLRPESVLKQGYFNLRCNLVPGCPNHLYPTSPIGNPKHPEEGYYAEAWRELFPNQRIPDIVSQPCCSQFALTAERIRSLPQSEYVRIRDWLLNTDMDDRISGRIFEYLWQIIFTGQNELCPVTSHCLCYAYGLCFGGEEIYQQRWGKKAERLEKLIATTKAKKGNGTVLVEEEMLALVEDMRQSRREAVLRGRDPVLRAEELQST